MAEASVEKPKISVSEIRKKLGPKFDRYSLADSAFLLMLDAIEEFSEDIREILIKKRARGAITVNERRSFDKARSLFWKKKFGINLEGVLYNNPREDSKNKEGLADDQKVRGNKQKREKIQNLEVIKRRKMQRMIALHSEFKNLDEGEIVTEFADETRRVVYFDEDANRYYVMEGNQQKYLGVGDLLSDYAWGIKYVPDGEMIEPAYRRMAKRILANEVRRDLEGFHNIELRLEYKSKDSFSSPSPTITPGKIKNISSSWEKTHKSADLGFVAEIMARELMARLAQNGELQIVVERADCIEDGVYKYDFKVRTLSTTRGIGIGDEKEIDRRIKKIGVQFTIAHNVDAKKSKFFKAKDKYKNKVPVDEIIFVQINPLEFSEAFNRWLELGKPSGGPEQFLSEEIKSTLLAEITAGLSVKNRNNNAG
jgi:hypothetical protein